MIWRLILTLWREICFFSFISQGGIGFEKKQNKFLYGVRGIPKLILVKNGR